MSNQRGAFLLEAMITALLVSIFAAIGFRAIGEAQSCLGRSSRRLILALWAGAILEHERMAARGLDNPAGDGDSIPADTRVITPLAGMVLNIRKEVSAACPGLVIWQVGGKYGTAEIEVTSGGFDPF